MRGDPYHNNWATAHLPRSGEVQTAKNGVDPGEFRPSDTPSQQKASLQRGLVILFKLLSSRSSVEGSTGSEDISEGREVRERGRERRRNDPLDDPEYIPSTP